MVTERYAYILDDNRRMNAERQFYSGSVSEEPTAKQGMFSGLLYCADCGAKLHFSTCGSLASTGQERLVFFQAKQIISFALYNSPAGFPLAVHRVSCNRFAFHF